MLYCVVHLAVLIVNVLFCCYQSKPSSAKSRPKSSKPASLPPASRRRPKSPDSESSDSWDNASMASLERSQVALRRHACTKIRIFLVSCLIINQSQLCVWTLIRCPFHPRVTAVARKNPRSFCQKCRWQVTPKHAYILDPTKSEWADYAAVKAECGNL